MSRQHRVTPLTALVVAAAISLASSAAFNDEGKEISDLTAITDRGEKFLQSDEVLPNVFVVLPGLGSVHRIDWVMNNINILKDELGNSFGCLLRIYAKGARDSKHFRSELFAPCNVEYLEGSKLFESVKAIDPMYYKGADTVFLLNDDIRLKSKTLQSLRTVMAHEKLDVVSVSYDEAWCKYMEPQPDKIAHRSGAVEFKAVLFNTHAFQCLQRHVDTTLNPTGWGYAAMYSVLCPVKMAVCDYCKVWHLSPLLSREPPTYNHTQAEVEMTTWFKSLGANLKQADHCDRDINKEFPSLTLKVMPGEAASPSKASSSSDPPAPPVKKSSKESSSSHQKQETKARSTQAAQHAPKAPAAKVPAAKAPAAKAPARKGVVNSGSKSHSLATTPRVIRREKR